MLICDKLNCTGCGVCAAVCPQQCITLRPDRLQQIMPEISPLRCVKCGLCTKTCPANRELQSTASPRCYAAWVKDKKERASSSSGGIASALYRQFISTGNAVVGACFEGGTFHLKLTSDQEEISAFRGSKYVHCYSDKIYSEVKSRLDRGQPVLFVGTPCQVAAIKQYTHQNNLLYTIDLICHGTPPQKYFFEHFSSRVKTISSVKFREGHEYEITLNKDKKSRTFPAGLDEYYLGFISGAIFRDSCYRCKYANLNRVSDITIGDFWGIDPAFLREFDTDKVSVVLVNTPRGEQLLKLTGGITMIPRDLSEATAKNEQLRNAFPISQDRIDFMRHYPLYGFDRAMHKLSIEKKRKKNIILARLLQVKHCIEKYLQKINNIFSFSGRNIKLSKTMEFTLLFASILLAFSIRIASWHLEPVVSRDAVKYITDAQRLSDNKGSFVGLAKNQHEFRQSPLFIAILSADIGGLSPQMIGLSMNIILGSLFPLLLWGIFRLLFPCPQLALTGAFLAALHPTLIDYSVEIQREIGYLFFAGSCIFFLVLLKNTKWLVWSFMAGVASTLALFFRYEGLELLCFFFIGSAILIVKKVISWKELILSIVVFMFSSILSGILLLLATNKPLSQWYSDLILKISIYF